VGLLGTQEQTISRSANNFEDVVDAAISAPILGRGSMRRRRISQTAAAASPQQATRGGAGEDTVFRKGPYFAHRKSRRQIERQTTIGMLATRAAQRVSRPFLILLVVVCLVDFAAPFAGTFIFRLVDRSVSDQSGSLGAWREMAVER